MEVIFDLYREKLHDELELRKYTSAADERALWTKTSKLFLWGRTSVAEPDEIYEGQPAETPTPATITASRNIELARHGEIEVDVPEEGASPGPVWGRYIEYRLVITLNADLPADGFIALADERIPRIARKPITHIVPPNARQPISEIAGRDDPVPDALILRLPALMPRVSFWLSFALPIREICVAPGLTVEEVERLKNRLAYRLTVSGAPSAERWLEIFVAESGLIPTLREHSADDPNPRPPDNRTAPYRWNLAGVELPANLQIAFEKRRSQ